MPNNDSTQNGGDNAALERSTSQPSETTANLHQDTNMGQVGDNSSNQAWSQMTGGNIGNGGGDRGAGGPGSSGGDSNASGRMDFSGDIYKGGSNGGPGAGSDQSNSPTNMEQSSQSRGISESSHGADYIGTAGPQGGSDSGSASDGKGGNIDGQSQAALDRGLDTSSTGSLYNESASFNNTQSHEGMHKTYEMKNPDGASAVAGDGVQDYGQGHSGKGESTDGKSPDAGDQPAKPADGKSGDAPPELSLPSPHDMANAPVDQLQQASKEQRQALANYIDGQGENFPHLALHGTNAQSGKNLENLPNRGGEIFAAGQAPERRDMGADQMVGDIGKSAETAFSYAENRQNSTGANQPGPVMVYDAKNQPEAFQKNNYGSGSESGDHSSFAQLDLGKANLVGSVPREQIDGMKQNFAPIEGALKGVSDNIAGDPKGINQDRVNDLSARVKVMDEMKSHHQTKLVLDAVHRGRGPRW